MQRCGLLVAALGVVSLLAVACTGSDGEHAAAGEDTAGASAEVEGGSAAAPAVPPGEPRAEPPLELGRPEAGGAPPAPLPPVPIPPVLIPPEPEPASVVDLRIADEREGGALGAALIAAGCRLLSDAAPPSEAQIIVSDAPLTGADAIDVRPWVVVAHQRHDVLEMSVEQVRAALRGAGQSWASFGGAAQPVQAFLPQEMAPLVRRALGLPAEAATVLPLEAVRTAVRETPGAIALIPPEGLAPGLLPIVVHGYDPLRDPDAGNPLWLRRWLRAPDEETRLAVIAALGWTEPSAGNPLGLLATGDFLPTRCVVDAVERLGAGDLSAIFAETGAALRAADVTLVSMELALVPEANVTPCTRTFILSAPAAAAAALAGAGVDVVSLAGNHAGDCYFGCGSELAIRHTIATLEAAGIAHAGTGENLAAARRPALIERDGVRLAVLSYEANSDHYFADEDQAGVAPLTEANLRADIAAAREVADHVIVAFSAGEEYVQTTLPQQEAAVRAAFEAGASLVIGNHPHTVQPLIEQAGGVAAFALGNFVFDQGWSQQTSQSVILEAGFSAERLLGYRVRPAVIRMNYRPEFVDPAGPEGRQVLTRLWEATDAWLARAAR